MARMTMIEAIRDAHAVTMAADDNVVVFGEDVGYFGGVFRCTAGLQERFGKNRCFDAPINESGIVGTAIGMAAYGLRPVVEMQFADYVYPGLRPDRLGGGPAALSLGQRLHRADGGPHADRRRHLRRPDPFPVARGAVHPCRRPEDGGAVQPLRRQGPADRRHRGQRPGDLPGAQTALQRPLRRPSRPAGDALVEASAGRGAGGPLHRAARQGRWCAARARRSPCWPTAPWCMSPVAAAETRRRRRDPRPAYPGAARSRPDRGIGEEDRPLRRRPRGDADLGLWRRALRARRRRPASTISRRRSSGSPAGTRPIRTPRNGTISPVRRASARR